MGWLRIQAQDFSDQILVKFNQERFPNPLNSDDAILIVILSDDLGRTGAHFVEKMLFLFGGIFYRRTDTPFVEKCFRLTR